MIEDKLGKIKLLAMDVDGTLTEGEMVVLNGQQVKFFNVYDGLGTRLALNFGLDVAWITGNTSEAVSDRAASLGVTEVYQGARCKTDALDDLAARHGLDMSEIAYIGDDLNDLPAFDRAGVAVAVANAPDEVKSRADMTTQRAGGHGAVREVIELVLKARGEWGSAVRSFLDELRREQDGKAGPEAVA
jgi:3-deoxy-D-manno-octulosonate 8-phosphate phosphatase (KDO 8-P phosphatase)